MVDSDSFWLNFDFARACSEHIQQQSAQCPWMGELDFERIRSSRLLKNSILPLLLGGAALQRCDN
jgi:hypothetical protein